MRQKILIVGAGKWSQKLVSILNLDEFQIENIPARNFIENLKFGNSIEFDLIWICTRPEIQCEILEFSHLIFGKMILEKPLALNIESHKNISEVINRDSRIFLSCPWASSALWKRVLELISQFHFSEIEIKRVGEKAHDYIPSELDWLPHDILLLSSIAEYSNSDLEWISIDTTGDEITRCYRMGNVNIKLNFFSSGTRKSKWTIKSSTGDFVEVDLLQGNIRICYGQKAFEESFENNSNLRNMVNDILNSRNNFGLRIQLLALESLFRTEPPK